MYALSVGRPWAPLLVAGLKTVENRRFRPPRQTMDRDGGWLVVHASRRWHAEAIDLATSILGIGVLDRLAVGDEFAATSPSGYLGIVRVAGWCDLTAGRRGATCECGPWSQPGRTHWRIAEGHRFHEPIAGPGRLGVWPVGTGPAAEARGVIELLEQRKRET